MTKKPSKHQRTQAPGNERSASPDADLLSAARQRLERERRAAIDRLRQLGGSFEGDDDVAPAGLAAGRDEGDQALASEQTNMALMTRERLAERIERLTAALERVSQGQYGRCSVCGRPIAASRLAAIPEAETCVSRQEQREGRTPGVAA